MTRACAVCGNQLPAGVRRDRAYCGAACRKAAYTERHRATATMKGGHARPRKARPRSAATIGGDWAAARDDLAVFAALVGTPLTPQQAALAQVDRRITVVVAPRQTGKTRTLAALGTWSAFRTPGILVLIVSASDEAARRVLAMVKDMIGRPPLAASVVDDMASLVRLSNGSVIRSVPASERAVRGSAACPSGTANRMGPEPF